MGMFDYVRCKYPLPLRDAASLEFQTKDTPCRMDWYEIREDGSLWAREYDSEEWKPCAMTGEICFYDGIDGVWHEFSAYFVRGQLKHMEQLSPPNSGEGGE